MGTGGGWHVRVSLTINPTLHSLQGCTYVHAPIFSPPIYQPGRGAAQQNEPNNAQLIPPGSGENYPDARASAVIDIDYYEVSLPVDNGTLQKQQPFSHPG